MNYVHSVQSGFKKYKNFSGRASRSEYWYWFLFCFIFSILSQVVDSVLFNIPVGQANVLHPVHAVFSLVVLLPTLAVAVRRIHDVNHNGWWLLVGLTIIGMLFPLLYWYCIKGTPGDNLYGPEPL